MGISSELTGTPWHVERYSREEGDNRRHRSRCAYYRKEDKYCSKYYEKCRGSSHCFYYLEKDPDSEEKTEKKVVRGKYENTKQISKTPKKISNKSVEKQINLSASALFPVGSKVVHKRFGEGTVKRITPERVSVEIKKKRVISLDLNTCLKNDLMIRVK